MDYAGVVLRSALICFPNMESVGGYKQCYLKILETISFYSNIVHCIMKELITFRNNIVIFFVCFIN